MKPGLEWLADLVRRVPILAIDVEAAHRASDATAISYAKAIREWQDEAALALAEAAQDVRSPAFENLSPDAYARAATASALLTLDASG